MGGGGVNHMYPDIRLLTMGSLFNPTTGWTDRKPEFEGGGV